MTGLWDNAVVHDVSGRDGPHRGAPEAPVRCGFEAALSAVSIGKIGPGGLRKNFDVRLDRPS